MSRIIVLAIGGLVGLVALVVMVMTPRAPEPWEETRLICSFQSHCRDGDCTAAPLPAPFRLVPRDATGRAQIGMEGHPPYMARFSGSDLTRFETESYDDTLPPATLRLYPDLTFAYERPADAVLATGQCAPPKASTRP